MTSVRLNFAFLLVILLGAGFFVSWWTIWDLRRIAGARPPGLDPRSLTVLRRTLTSTSGGDDALAVIFLAQAFDCRQAIDELQTIDKLAISAGIPALLILQGSDSAEAQELRQTLNLSMAALADPSGTLTRATGIPRSPWKALLDFERGSILLEDGPAPTPPEVEWFRLRAAPLLSARKSTAAGDSRGHP